MNKSRINKITKEISAINKKIEALSGLYERRDALTAELVEMGFKKNDRFILRDNFKNKTKIFRTTSISRWEVEEI